MILVFGRKMPVMVFNLVNVKKLDRNITVEFNTRLN